MNNDNNKNITTLSTSKDTVWRTIIKTFFFKVCTTGATALMLGSIGKAITIHIVMTIIYLIYERIWNKIKWGKIIVITKTDNI